MFIIDQNYKVYKYTNKYNGKVYIGQTKNDLQERAQHNGKNYCECRRFYNAIKGYGWDAFEPTILADGLTIEEANRLEQFYIEKYDSMNPDYGYNLQAGGMNHDVCPETCKLISENAKERYKNPENNPMYGRKHSPEAIKKMSDAKMGDKNPAYGKKQTEEHKMKVRSALELARNDPNKFKLSDEARAKLSDRCKLMGEARAKAIRCIEDDIVFESLTDAAQHYNVAICSISDHLHGRSKTCAKRHFEFYKGKSATTISKESTLEIGTSGSGGTDVGQCDIV